MGCVPFGLQVGETAAGLFGDVLAALPAEAVVLVLDAGSADAQDGSFRAAHERARAEGCAATNGTHDT